MSANKYEKASNIWFLIFSVQIVVTAITGIVTIIFILKYESHSLSQAPWLSYGLAFIGSLLLTVFAYSNTQHYERLANKESKKG